MLRALAVVLMLLLRALSSAPPNRTKVLSSNGWPRKVPTPMSRKMLEDSPGGHASVVAVSVLWTRSSISTRAVF